MDAESIAEPRTPGRAATLLRCALAAALLAGAAPCASRADPTAAPPARPAAASGAVCAACQARSPAEVQHCEACGWPIFLKAPPPPAGARRAEALRKDGYFRRLWRDVKDPSARRRLPSRPLSETRFPVDPAARQTYGSMLRTRARSRRRAPGYPDDPMVEVGLSRWDLHGGPGDWGPTLSVGRVHVDPGDNTPLSVTALEFWQHAWTLEGATPARLETTGFMVTRTIGRDWSWMSFGLCGVRADLRRSPVVATDSDTAFGLVLGFSFIRLFELRAIHIPKTIDDIDLGGTQLVLRYLHQF